MLALIKSRHHAVAAADRLIEGEADLRKKAVYMDLKALLLSKVVQE